MSDETSGFRLQRNHVMSSATRPDDDFEAYKAAVQSAPPPMTARSRSDLQADAEIRKQEGLMAYEIERVRGEHQHLVRALDQERVELMAEVERLREELGDIEHEYDSVTRRWEACVGRVARLRAALEEIAKVTLGDGTDLRERGLIAEAGDRSEWAGRRARKALDE